jgi:hypothetical protein
MEVFDRTLVDWLKAIDVCGRWLYEESVLDPVLAIDLAPVPTLLENEAFREEYAEGG